MIVVVIVIIVVIVVLWLTVIILPISEDYSLFIGFQNLLIVITYLGDLFNEIAGKGAVRT